MLLTEEFRSYLKKNGADLVGFGDVSGLAPGGYQRAVVMAIALPKEIVRGIPQGPTQEYIHAYQDINRRLDELADLAAAYLSKKGFRSMPLTRENCPWDRESMSTAFPYKTSATRAGLGWIGKCALLVTKEFGSAIRMSVALTDAPLQTAEPIDRSLCGSCEKCMDACPGKAIKGTAWYAGLPRTELVDISSCDRAARDIAEEKLGYRTTMCGKCFAACPYTQRYLK